MFQEKECHNSQAICTNKEGCQKQESKINFVGIFPLNDDNCTLCTRDIAKIMFSKHDFQLYV